MIYASLNYRGEYSSHHRLIYRILKANFDNVREGLQGDSWIEVSANNQRVSVDSFTSLKHEVKGRDTDEELVNEVIEVLRRRLNVTIINPPESEAHE
ncbi:MAG: hypothetical protein KDA55_01915 [Planctomycetales bacterium]|nr:hypothetical protein [Planctomycetales bacterium]